MHLATCPQGLAAAMGKWRLTAIRAEYSCAAKSHFRLSQHRKGPGRPSEVTRGSMKILPALATVTTAASINTSISRLSRWS